MIGTQTTQSLKKFKLLAIAVAAMSAMLMGSPVRAASPFAASVLNNFKTWDADQDGTLTAKEIDQLVLNPAIKGDDAVAVATLKLAVRGQKVKMPKLTVAYFTDYAKTRGGAAPAKADDKPADNVDIDSSEARDNRNEADGVKWDSRFAQVKTRISRSGANTLPNETILRQNLRQGPLGDCFYVAAVGAYVSANPQGVQKLITPMPDGKYSVKFPAWKDAIVVGPITEAQMGISSTTGGQGNWVVILEQAFGRYRVLNGYKADGIVEMTDIITRGGSSNTSITALTGKETMRISLPKPTERDAKSKEILGKLRKELTEAMRDKRVVTAGILPNGDVRRGTSQIEAGGDDMTALIIPPNINTKHVYGVVGYDPQTDMVQVWNPHGQKFQPKGKPGLANGYATENGLFTLPLTEMYRIYTAFTFETTAPVGQKTAAARTAD